MNKKEEFEQLSYEESREIAVDIIKYHGIFYKFWDLVRPSYTNSKKYPTACVVFNKHNDCVDFIINKKFPPQLGCQLIRPILYIIGLFHGKS